ncbi:MAG: dihydrofolate reductase [Rhodobacteraceae bacterium]|nr:dihydrofolate reductase [Paracoccaceae bacterium]
MIKAILACDDDWGIGKSGDLPWPHNPNDLKWFKEKTIGGVVVMGKSTWDSLPLKPLPKRENIIVTSRDQILGESDYKFVKFPGITQKLLEMDPSKTIWVIGGAKLIDGLLDIIAEFHLSHIKGSYNCDTFLPKTLIKERYRLKESGKFGDGSFNIWCKK